MMKTVHHVVLICLTLQSVFAPPVRTSYSLHHTVMVHIGRPKLNFYPCPPNSPPLGKKIRIEIAQFC